MRERSRIDGRTRFGLALRAAQAASVGTDFARHHAVKNRSLGDAHLGSISVACYKPKPGCEEALPAPVREHLPPLRAAGLVTPRESIVMRTADGSVIEVFGWVSQEAIANAHSHPVVLEFVEEV